MLPIIQRHVANAQLIVKEKCISRTKYTYVQEVSKDVSLNIYRKVEDLGNINQAGELCEAIRKI